MNPTLLAGETISATFFRRNNWGVLASVVHRMEDETDVRMNMHAFSNGLLDAGMTPMGEGSHQASPRTPSYDLAPVAFPGAASVRLLLYEDGFVVVEALV